MNLNDVPKDYVPITASNTDRLAGYAGLLCRTAGTVDVKWHLDNGQVSATRSIPMVVGQELYGQPAFVLTSSTAGVSGIVP